MPPVHYSELSCADIKGDREEGRCEEEVPRGKFGPGQVQQWNTTLVIPPWKQLCQTLNSGTSRGKTHNSQYQNKLECWRMVEKWLLAGTGTFHKWGIAPLAWHWCWAEEEKSEKMVFCERGNWMRYNKFENRQKERRQESLFPSSKQVCHKTNKDHLMKPSNTNRIN